MIVLRDKYKDVFFHNFSQDNLQLIKEQIPKEFNKHFTEE